MKLDIISIGEQITYNTTKYSWECECASIPYTMGNGTAKYRLIVLRIPIKDHKNPDSWVTEGKYGYKLLLTNDFASSIEEIVQFNNLRGASELNFHVLKAHHGWKYPPFSFLNQNLVFFILTSIANNIYYAVLNKIKEKLPELKLGNIRPKRFKDLFIEVICECLNGVFDFGQKNELYKKLL